MTESLNDCPLCNNEPGKREECKAMFPSTLIEEIISAFEANMKALGYSDKSTGLRDGLYALETAVRNIRHISPSEIRGDELDLIPRLQCYRDMLKNDDNKYIVDRCISIAESYLGGELDEYRTTKREYGDEVFELKKLLNLAGPYVPRSLITNDSEITVYKRIRAILSKPEIEGGS